MTTTVHRASITRNAVDGTAGEAAAVLNGRDAMATGHKSQGNMTMMTLREFFRYEFVANRFACEDCSGKHDVVRCICWFADEGDREVTWYQCCQCLRDEFRLDTSDEFKRDPVLLDLAVWLKTDKRDPLITSCDLPSPEERGGLTLGQVLIAAEP
jgi:hypothetical protein